MEEEKGMLEVQLAAKQDTVDDLMAETEALEVRHPFVLRTPQKANRNIIRRTTFVLQGTAYKMPNAS